MAPHEASTRDPTEQLASTSGGGCPVGFGASKAPEACTGQSQLNDKNNMEAPNQQPAPNQPYRLPTKRNESTIRNSEGASWIYPSEQVRAPPRSACSAMYSRLKPRLAPRRAPLVP
jgi:hypothetical protein